MIRKKRKGNVLLQSSDENLLRVLYMYFERKYYNVFCPQNNKEFEQIVKNNALSFVIFDDEKNIQLNMVLANALLEFDNQIVIYFICQNKETKHLVEQTNPLFFTIIKPFSMRNLLNTMNASANKLKNDENRITTFNIGKYRFNSRMQLLVFKVRDTQEGQHLTKKENSILLMLCQNMGKIVSKHRLLMDIWKKDNYQSARSMDVYMTRLRKYLEKDPNVSIKNTHSVGYTLQITEK